MIGMGEIERKGLLFIILLYLTVYRITNDFLRFGLQKLVFFFFFFSAWSPTLEFRCGTWLNVFELV
jgi:hypothetical protein